MNPSVLNECLTSEAQAIGIYEGECFILKRLPKTIQGRTLEMLLNEILHEEKGHLNALHPWQSNLSSGLRASVHLNRVVGWCLGSILAFLPARWIARVHILGESAAAQIYKTAESALSSEAGSALCRELAHSAEQEEKHVRLFRNFLKESAL